MNYAFDFKEHGAFTPDGRFNGDVAAHNAACEAAELAAIEAGEPIVVYPKFDETLPSGRVVRGRQVVTLWTGKVVGEVLRASTYVSNFGWHQTLTAYTWRDLTGRKWHGRGAGNGMALISRRSKS